MGAIGNDGLAVPGRVELAREPPFSLGLLSVHPPTRQVVALGQRLTLEPKVMQVLVALARAGGTVVTRDQLIDCCWEGRSVGNDAVDRVIGRIRVLAREVARDSFKIETIPRVGYLLLPTEAEPASATAATTARRAPFFSRRGVIGGSVAMFSAAAAAAVLILRNRSPNAEAIRFYEQGLAIRGQGSFAQTEQSVAYLREAVRADPDFADAWGALSWAYCALLEYGPRADAENIRFLARSAAAKALDLDPANVSARGALLTLRPNFQNWERIERGCRTLFAADPGNTVVALNLAFNFCEVGRWREAAKHLADVVRREPLWPLSRRLLIMALVSTGNSFEADEAIGAALELWPQHGDLWFVRVRFLILTQRYQEAQRLLADTASQPEGLNRAEVELEKSLAAALADDSEARRRSTAAEFLEIARQDMGLATDAALTNGLLGFPGPAFELLEGYYFGRGPWAHARSDRPRTLFLFNQTARPLRSDPRFDRLLQELRLEDYWKATGSKPDFRQLA